MITVHDPEAFEQAKQVLVDSGYTDEVALMHLGSITDHVYQNAAGEFSMVRYVKELKAMNLNPWAKRPTIVVHDAEAATQVERMLEDNGYDAVIESASMLGFETIWTNGNDTVKVVCK
jgi:hypothetical protein